MTYRTVLTVVLETESLGLPVKTLAELREWAENQTCVEEFRVVEIHSRSDSDTDMDILDWPISSKELGFSTRVINALTMPRRRKRENSWAIRDCPEDIIRTLGDLLACDEYKLLSYANFGRSSLEEVRQVIARYGLHLLGEAPSPLSKN